MHSGVQGSVPSDQYNCTSYATSSQHGYGLGHSEMKSERGKEARAASFAAPLTPFAGVDRRAIPPRQEQVSVTPPPFLSAAISLRLFLGQPRSNGPLLVVL
jgi:hypothetical protein